MTVGAKGSRVWRQNWLAVPALFLFATLLIGCDGTQRAVSPAAEAAPDSTREPARDFSLKSLNGDTVTLSEHQGGWVLLNFWATWCPPCVKEMPYLNELAVTRDLQVLGVNFKEDAATARRFVDEHGISFPILIEPDDITLLVYAVRALPRTFLIAPDGYIALEIAGEVDPARLDAWLDAQGLPALASH